jgi:hypothetical protein
MHARILAYSKYKKFAKINSMWVCLVGVSSVFKASTRLFATVCIWPCETYTSRVYKGESVSNHDENCWESNMTLVSVYFPILLRLLEKQYTRTINSWGREANPGII